MKFQKLSQKNGIPMETRVYPVWDSAVPRRAALSIVGFAELNYFLRDSHRSQQRVAKTGFTKKTSFEHSNALSRSQITLWYPSRVLYGRLLTEIAEDTHNRLIRNHGSRSKEWKQHKVEFELWRSTEGRAPAPRL